MRGHVAVLDEALVQTSQEQLVALERPHDAVDRVARGVVEVDIGSLGTALFPFCILGATLGENLDSYLGFALWILQYPCYGVLIGEALRRGRNPALMMVLTLAGIHVLAALCAHFLG